MLNLLIEKFLENRITVLFFFLVFVIFGLFAVKQLPIDAIPDITPTQVMVNTKTGALDPEQIEKTVTYYIETEMAGIPKVRDVRSLSRFGLSQVVIVFEEGTDIYWARQLVLERIQNIKDKLPGGLNPELGPISTGLGEIVLFSVDAKKDTELWKKPEKERLIYLRTITDFVVRPFLKSHIPNIADIDVTGGYKKQVHIDIQPEKMIQYGLTFHEVIAKVESLGDNFGGGYIQNEGKQIIVRTNGLINNLEAIRKLPVKLNFYGKAIQLGDIALIREDHMERVGAAILEGKETVVGTVFMLLGANSREVSQNAVKAIHEIPLPSDVQIRVVYDRSFLVDATIKTVINNLSEGAILVIIVLLMVLGNFRAAIIVSLAIPICMVFALTAMKHLNISANLLSLGAIDFGLLVDGSVVVVENIIRKLQIAKRTESQTSSFQIILEACKEVVQPVTFGLVIVMVVYIPILSLEGIEGKMFKPMAVSVFMALIASLIVALFIMPIFSFFLLKRDKMSHKDSFVFHYVQKGFSPLLNFALKFKILVLTIAFLFGSLCLFLYMRMGSDFIPPLDEGDMSIGFVRDPNIGIDESLRQQKLIETTISKIPEVELVFSRTGTAESATDPMGVNMSDTYVMLKKDKDTWRKVNGITIEKYAIYKEIKEKLDKLVPEQEMGYTQPIELRFNEILEGSRADVSLRIFGRDLEKLLEYQEKARDILRKIPGSSSVELDAITALRRGHYLNINLDYNAIARYGLSLPEVNSVVKTSMSGVELGSFYEYDWRFPIVLRLSEEYRNDVKEIEKIPVGFPEGGSIPLNSISKIRYESQISNIARSNARRYAAVAVNLQGRDVESFVLEAKEKVAKELKLPEGYYTYWGGQFKNLEKAKARLALIVPATLIVVFLLILKTFGNVKHALLVYSAIPFALTGGVLSLYFRGMSLSISASIGFIAMIGIGTLDSMVLISFFQHLKEEGKTVRETVIEGTMTRLRPVITTSIVAGLGFLPMAINTSMGAEVQRPLATVVIGGLVTSTSLTLILLPVLYELSEKDKRKEEEEKEVDEEKSS